MRWDDDWEKRFEQHEKRVDRTFRVAWFVTAVSALVSLAMIVFLGWAIWRLVEAYT